MSTRKMNIWLWLGELIVLAFLFSCRGNQKIEVFQKVDSLNQVAYSIRYKNVELAEQTARKALNFADGYSSGKAMALNNLAFCRFIRMDFEQSDSLLREVYRETSNELEFLIADIGLMKLCQRTAKNKEFYDYRNSALRYIKRISEDEIAMSDEHIRSRFNYAKSEFSITSSIYYYYLQQEEQAKKSIREVDLENELEKDQAQLLYYYYMKGSGGLCEAKNPDDITLEEFDYLLDCLTLSREHGYIYFEANALQALSELLKYKENFDLLMQRRSGMMRVINQNDFPWEKLAIHLAEKALDLFDEYGDWYQIAFTNRTLASCYMELGIFEKSLDYLTKALSFVNLHHEKYYHCEDTLDRLKPYIPMATNSIELQWINQEGIMTVPEWIARFREQLSVTYAALGLKPQSDYNRNIYLDILDYTRQDKELESRYVALQAESLQLNVLLVMVVAVFIILVILLKILNRRWRIRNTLYIEKLKQTLEICRRITSSVPSDAKEMTYIIHAIMEEVEYDLLQLVGASDMQILVSTYEQIKEEGCCLELPLETSEKKVIGQWRIYAENPLKKENRVLLQIVAPYIAWTLENGLTLISLGEECSRLEKEQYIHEQHLIENKRQNIIKKACLFIVTGITPYIDRVINEIHKLISFNYLADRKIKESKYRYVDELVSRINEYNDILALWIKMRQGVLSLNIENFELESLFEILKKSKKNFEMKNQILSVKSAPFIVKADKALTLFMINTLTENARKYTQRGGKIEVFAREENDYIEISIQDNGPGLSVEDVQRILGEKVYDSGQIGLRTTFDTTDLQKNKGYGFGLMNCKGIIEKYRKTNIIFHVCGFFIDSRLGEGSRFYFRLPKGLRRTMGVWLVGLLSLCWGCSHSLDKLPEESRDEPEDSEWINDHLLDEANRLANKVYEANLSGIYQDALLYADSALVYLNTHYQTYSSEKLPLLSIAGEGNAAELQWFENHFETDYYTLLDVRNEVAVACLALGLFDAYQYNNQAYTALYKQISVDSSLGQYCEQMQQSANNKIVSIVLCVVLLLCLLIGYYLLYFRHYLTYRYNLEQVFEVNSRAFSIPIVNLKEGNEIASALVNGLFKEMNELIPLEVLGITICGEESNTLYYAFSSSNEKEEYMKEEMFRCYQTKKPLWNKNIKCLPLCLEIHRTVRCLGVMAIYGDSEVNREEDRLMLELATNYVSIIVYNAIEIVAQKYRDIEVAQDEARRVVREETTLHVQNMVLDNCLSTIKHETIYYPNKIKQIIAKLNQGIPDTKEKEQVETIAELIGYYKDIFTILSSCAARQLEEITFRRTIVAVSELSEHINHYFRRIVRKLSFQLELQMKIEDVELIGDVVQLKFLLENLVNEAVTYKQNGLLEIQIYKEGAFVRMDFIDRRRTIPQEELNQLFYPHLSRMQQGSEDLRGTEYLICKQIIREHDEFAGRRGCRMNAEVMKEGGFVVWCTVPAK